jgi:hypothetical protein
MSWHQDLDSVTNLSMLPQIQEWDFICCACIHMRNQLPREASRDQSIEQKKDLYMGDVALGPSARIDIILHSVVQKGYLQQ